MKNFAVELAYDIIEMNERIQILELENSRLRKYEEKYNNLMRESIAHSGKMMNNMLDVLQQPEKYRVPK